MTDRLMSPETKCSVLWPVPVYQSLPGPVEVPTLQVNTQLPLEEAAFHEWCQLKMKNSELVSKTQYFLNKLEELKERLGEMEEQQNSRKSSKPKRHRRTADKIDRKHTCPNCDKSYGSEGSLLQHVHLKHGKGEAKEEESPSR